MVVVIFFLSCRAGYAETFRKSFVAGQALVFGVRRDCTQHLLWRVQSGELSGLHPRDVVLMIGINNLFVSHAVEETALGGAAVTG